LKGGAREDFDRSALTLPSPAVSKLCPGLAPREHGLLNGTRYQGIICASALIKKPLEGYYVTNITDAVPFTAVIEMTALVDPEELGGNHLVYLPWYVDANDDAAFATTDTELRERFWGALKSMHPKLGDDDLVEFKVSRARHVMALSTLGYSESLPPRDTSVAGVHVVNSAMICNGTLNVNETVGIAESASADLAALPALRKETATTV
jgi:protoporphyrinogen oxidase